MKKELDVVFILDRSGSMSGSEENTITSFNEYLEKEKKNKFKTNITTVLFSHEFEYLHKREDVKSVKPLTNKDYYVGGCTALYDALGNSILDLEKVNPKKALFIIITDGYENASMEFNKDKIKKLIKKHSEWEFIYIGADIDSYASAGEIGIRKDNIANYKKDRAGTNILFNAVGNFECEYLSDTPITSRWKKDLDKYIEQNKND